MTTQGSSSQPAKTAGPATNAATDAADIKNVYAGDLLTGKVALVTGASRGIGRAIAIGFGALGAKVAVNYAGNEKAAAETVSEIEKAGGKALAVQFDVSNFTAVQDTIKALEKDLGGAFDILVNNAGVSRDGLFVRMKEEDWDFNINVNLKGAFNCARGVTPGMMKKRSGKIINISSVIGLLGNGGQTAYSASKSGLFGLTKSLAREFASRNIQVNAIAPGFISTDMTLVHGEKLQETVLKQIPQDRLGDPVDVAQLAIFLASRASDYVTGQTFAVDGGMTMV